MKIISILAILVLASVAEAQQYNCCPSRALLMKRYGTAVRNGYTPRMPLELYTPEEQLHLWRGMVMRDPVAWWTYGMSTQPIYPILTPWRPEYPQYPSIKRLYR